METNSVTHPKTRVKVFSTFGVGMTSDAPEKHGYTLVKPAATGKERDQALARIEAISSQVGKRAAADGLTEEQLQAILNDPD